MRESPISTLASPFNHKGLANLRNRRFNEDPMHQGTAISGEKIVWYKVDKSAGICADGADKLLEIVGNCFRNEGLTPESRVLMGTEPDKRYTLSFSFPASMAEAVNKAVGKINEASRRLQQQGMAIGSQSV